MQGESTAQKKTFRRALGDWFRASARDLPWRETRSLYRTVISEFMLQQTQVKTMLPYFDRWMQLFPDFETLAKAEEASVLKAWEGLGYYNRARNLHKLAKALTALPDVPQTPEAWQALPGVGPYSSAAISSLAQGYAAAVVDGNVVRVLARITGNRQCFESGAEAIEAIRPAADAFLDKQNPGLHNEAMMELGALICLKNNPSCMICPVQHCCRAFNEGTAESIPNIQRKKTEKVLVERVLLENAAGEILLRKAPHTAKRLANIYEFPTAEEVKVSLTGKALLFKGSRGIANQRIEERFYKIASDKQLEAHIAGDSLLEWICEDRLEEIPLSGPHRKWLGKVIQAIEK
ncbi:MAG: A/G-specific adenine glycosylase [Opitutales bacterium]|nr:A/G-specific adenine glycosylase [Opitutales bacterium]